TAIAGTFPHLDDALGESEFTGPEAWWEKVSDDSKLALFSAAPHGAAAAIIDDALSRTENMTVHVVDSSADFRYASRGAFESVYEVDHGAPDLLGEFCCALPEHVAGAPARHIGHPGCFATAILLASVPLLKSGLVEPELFVSAVTGSTGSGKSPQTGTHHPERHSNLYAYRPLAHRHSPEIVALAAAATGVDVRVNFVPHSGPFARGIYATVQAKTSARVDSQRIQSVFEEAYAGAPFVDIVSGTPRLKSVVASNRCQIGVDAAGDTVVVMSAIDNLVKGAAGGAVQWMNRLWGLPETSGLTAPAPAWT
ncbi:MAG: N-acetyl-gamma-glutamyl-phosphate reductase, partial [Woeseiaceae bacterium]